jgi:hypothetical protein
MPAKRFTVQQIVAELREAEKRQTQGRTIESRVRSSARRLDVLPVAPEVRRAEGRRGLGVMRRFPRADSSGRPTRLGRASSTRQPNAEGTRPKSTRRFKSVAGRSLSRAPFRKMDRPTSKAMRLHGHPPSRVSRPFAWAPMWRITCSSCSVTGGTCQTSVTRSQHVHGTRRRERG